jgi:hypothetical protein
MIDLLAYLNNMSNEALDRAEADIAASLAILKSIGGGE